MNTKYDTRDWLYKPFYNLVITLPCEVKGVKMHTFYMSFYKGEGND
nr:MAG TPA: hypothetical protein [Caudoviricetes sp.]